MKFCFDSSLSSSFLNFEKIQISIFKIFLGGGGDVCHHEVWTLLKLMTLICNCPDVKDEKNNLPKYNLTSLLQLTCFINSWFE